MGLVRTLALALSTCVALSSFGEEESVIRGQIHGIDPVEGAWIGIVTGEPSYNHSWRLPHDSFEADLVPAEKPNWSFSATGKFELKTGVEEEAVLLIVAKNRLPVEIPLPLHEEIEPIETSVSPGVSLKGIVQTEDGKPVVGATLSFLPSEDSYHVPLFARPKWTTTADGSFHLQGLKGSSRYIVGVTAEGHAPVILGGLEIPEDGIDRLVVKLEDGYFVSGRVIDEDKKPVSDIDVIATWARDARKVLATDGVLKVTKSEGFIIDRTGTRTRSDGSFRMGPFARGTDGKLYTGSSMGSAISREVSAPYEDLVLKLKQASVRGRVLDGNSGAPIERFTVDMYIGEPRTHTIESSDGTFDLPVLRFDEDGTELTIRASGYGEWTRPLFEGSSGVYDLGEIALEASRTIRGVVRDAQTGSPIRGVMMFGKVPNHDPYIDKPERDFSFSRLTNSNKAGAFKLVGLDRRIDSLFLIVRGRHFVSVDLPVDVEEFNIDLRLDGVIEGSLVLPDRTPVKGKLAMHGSNWLLPRRTNIDGQFQVEGLAPDTYTLVVETDAGWVETRTVTLKDGERLSEIDLIVQPGWSVSGTIGGLPGNERVVIEVEDSESRVLTRKRFENGPYTIHGLPPETTMIARASSGHTIRKEFLDGSMQDSVVDFHFDAESRLTGWMTSEGEPLRGVSLQIVPENSSAATANVITTESGRYEAGRLLDGRYTVHSDTGHSFEVEINGNTAFDIEVPKNSLSGIVRGERTRNPIGAGRVTLVMSGTLEDKHPIEIIRRVGSDGTFLFEGLVSGDYDISIEHPHAETVTGRINISGPETVEMEVQCANTQDCLEGSPEDRRFAVSN